MMVELQLSEWLKSDEFPPDGTLVVKFLDEGEFGVYKQEGKSDRETFTIRVAAGKGVERLWTMNLTSQRSVAEKLGLDTKSWVGQSVELFLVDQMVGKVMRKVIYARGKV